MKASRVGVISIYLPAGIWGGEQPLPPRRHGLQREAALFLSQVPLRNMRACAETNGIRNESEQTNGLLTAEGAREREL